MKIFQVGFNKCGTKTIHHYLRSNGVSSIHWDEGNLARRIYRNLANGERLLTGYEEFVAFTDMEYLSASGSCFLEAYKLFPYLADQYPDSVFILNTRDREAWLRSRLRHVNNYVARQKKWFNVSSEAELLNVWRADWERHHRRVTEFFINKPHRFLLCRIETDLPHLLSERLPELGLDESLYKLRHRTTDRDSSFISTRQRAKRLLDRLLP